MSHSLGERLRGRTFLIAGATGFLGKVVLALLLEHIPEVRVVLIVRRKGPRSASRRIAELFHRNPVFRSLRRAWGAEYGKRLMQRVVVIEGDLEHAPPLSEAFLADVDLTLNLAGTIDFVADPREAVGANHDGALALARMARKTRSTRMVHTSTCYVSGPGERLVEERFSPTTPLGRPLDYEGVLSTLNSVSRSVETARTRSDIGHRLAQELGWPNIYTLSKKLGEVGLAQMEGLECCIVRPSIIENSANYPFSGWNEGMKTVAPMTWLMHSGLFRVPAHPEHRLDVVPVDDVARAVLHAAAFGGARDIWQVATSSANPIFMERWCELSTLAALKHGAPDGNDWIARTLQPRLLGQRDTSPLAPERLSNAVAWGSRLFPRLLPWNQMDRTLKEAHRACDLLASFMLEHNHSYISSRLEAASRQLPPDEQALQPCLYTLDWRDYVVDVFYPGVQQWCFPRVRGEKVPLDAPIGEQPVFDSDSHRVPSSSEPVTRSSKVALA